MDRMSSDFLNLPPERFTSRRDPSASASWSASDLDQDADVGAVGPQRRCGQLQVHRIVHAAHSPNPTARISHPFGGGDAARGWARPRSDQRTSGRVAQLRLPA